MLCCIKLVGSCSIEFAVAFLNFNIQFNACLLPRVHEAELRRGLQIGPGICPLLLPRAALSLQQMLFEGPNTIMQQAQKSLVRSERDAMSQVSSWDAS